MAIVTVYNRENKPIKTINTNDYLFQNFENGEYVFSDLNLGIIKIKNVDGSNTYYVNDGQAFNFTNTGATLMHKDHSFREIDKNNSANNWDFSNLGGTRTWESLNENPSSPTINFSKGLSDNVEFNGITIDPELCGNFAAEIKLPYFYVNKDNKQEKISAIHWDNSPLKEGFKAKNGYKVGAEKLYGHKLDGKIPILLCTNSDKIITSENRDNIKYTLHLRGEYGSLFVHDEEKNETKRFPYHGEKILEIRRRPGQYKLNKGISICDMWDPDNTINPDLKNSPGTYVLQKWPRTISAIEGIFTYISTPEKDYTCTGQIVFGDNDIYCRSVDTSKSTYTLETEGDIKWSDNNINSEDDLKYIQKKENFVLNFPTLYNVKYRDYKQGILPESNLNIFYNDYVQGYTDVMEKGFSLQLTVKNFPYVKLPYYNINMNNIPLNPDVYDVSGDVKTKWDATAVDYYFDKADRRYILVAMNMILSGTFWSVPGVLPRCLPIESTQWLSNWPITSWDSSAKKRLEADNPAFGNYKPVSETYWEYCHRFSSTFTHTGRTGKDEEVELAHFTKIGYFMEEDKKIYYDDHAFWAILELDSSLLENQNMIGNVKAEKMIVEDNKLKTQFKNTFNNDVVLWLCTDKNVVNRDWVSEYLPIIEANSTLSWEESLEDLKGATHFKYWIGTKEHTISFKNLLKMNLKLQLTNDVLTITTTNNTSETQKVRFGQNSEWIEVEVGRETSYDISNWSGVLSYLPNVVGMEYTENGQVIQLTMKQLDDMI